MKVFFVFLFFTSTISICFNEWCTPVDYETKLSFWMVVHKTLEKNHNSFVRTLLWCGDGSDDCNTQWHWAYNTKLFATRKGAIEWINMEFFKEPERVVALRECNVPETLHSTTTKHTRTEVTETTMWFEYENQTKTL